jgi:tryptophan synthase alpha chain
MSRIKQLFEEFRAADRTALVTYIMAGDPRPEETVELLHSVVAAGSDIVELGMPFSDPMADGPVIQAAAERALAQGVDLKRVLAMVAEFREQDNATPVVLMGYLNPIEAMGYAEFAERANKAGVDGMLLVDLPPEEAVDVGKAFRLAGLDMIFLSAPTTSPERQRMIGTHGSGFAYYVSLKGVTGAASMDVDAVAARIKELRQHTALPLGVGFGISTPETAARVAGIADAVVVGSALVKRVESYRNEPARMRQEVGALITSMRRAMDSAAAA